MLFCHCELRTFYEVTYCIVHCYIEFHSDLNSSHQFTIDIKWLSCLGIDPRHVPARGPDPIDCTIMCTNSQLLTITIHNGIGLIWLGRKAGHFILVECSASYLKHSNRLTIIDCKHVSDETWRPVVINIPKQLFFWESYEQGY